MSPGWERQPEADEEFALPEQRQVSAPVVAERPAALSQLHRQVSAPAVSSRPALLSSLAGRLGFLGGGSGSSAVSAAVPCSPTAVKKLLHSVGAVAKTLCTPVALALPDAARSSRIRGSKEKPRWLRITGGLGEGASSLHSLRCVAGPEDSEEVKLTHIVEQVPTPLSPRGKSARSVRRCHTAPQRLVEMAVEEVEPDSVCQICCTAPSEVVLLPCRHSGLCDACLRRVMFMRAPHRGGCCCPFCRRRIREVVRIDPAELAKPAGAPRYGHTEGVNSWSLFSVS
mmetsp:Transcript_102032/g.263779  ORF Transcript_102032/g.263779 Transcript_102032/m.263779 type:complete len:284 (+) Transcript_102032:73-924(+)